MKILRGRGRRLVVISTAVAAVVAGTGLAAGGVSATPPSGGTLRIAAIADVSSFDPPNSQANTDVMILYPLYDTLTRMDQATMEPLPGLARSWEFVDPTTLRFELETGVTFQDGTPFDAAAVEFSIERHRDLSIYPELVNVEDVVVVDDDTVDFELSAPDASLINVLSERAGMIVSPTAVEEYGDDFGSHPVGTGPYVIDDYRSGDRLVLKRFDDYWGDPVPGPDVIEYRFMLDSATAAKP